MNRSIPAAKKLLQSSGISNKALAPTDLVAASNQLGTSLEATLNLIAYLKSGGQGFSPFAQTAKVLTGQYS